MEGVRYAGQFPAEGLLCSSCRMAPPPFERAVAYAVYQDELREMIHLLKYEQMRTVAKPLGRLLARAIETLQGEAGPEMLVVAVPLFPAKERQRGYNQAVLLCQRCGGGAEEKQANVEAPAGACSDPPREGHAKPI